MLGLGAVLMGGATAEMTYAHGVCERQIWPRGVVKNRIKERRKDIINIRRYECKIINNDGSR